MSFTPYLFFSGNCAEAFGRYHEIFGGKLDVMTFADAPPSEAAMPGAEPSMVMHAALTVGDTMLMGSDDPTGDGGPKVGIAVTHTAADEATARAVFDALSDGGRVDMPFEPTFFSNGFGVCTDRFGIPWMIDTAGDPSPD